MATIYGYGRISTKKQNIDRQIRNITALYPDAKIYQEVFTGRKQQGRKELEKILKRVESGDTIVFDSVSRMSRNTDEGTQLYFELYDKGIDLVFIKEPYVDTQIYKQAIESKSLERVGDETDILLKGVEDYLKALAKKQIRIAFEQSQKEVDDLSKRTAEGVKTAQLNGKIVGHPKGQKLHIKKAAPAKKLISDITLNVKDFEISLDLSSGQYSMRFTSPVELSESAYAGSLQWQIHSVDNSEAYLSDDKPLDMMSDSRYIVELDDYIEPLSIDEIEELENFEKGEDLL